jgi:diacylglycerol kinase (ATP)
MRTCIILNPHAGTVNSQPAVVDRLRAVFGSDLWLTQHPHDATALARTALQRGYDRVVAAGGDGTISEVLNGLAPHFERVQFGILPVGTANDFARSLDLPADLETALARLSSGVTRKLDLVQITTDRIFYCINVSAGLVGCSTK